MSDVNEGADLLTAAKTVETPSETPVAKKPLIKEPAYGSKVVYLRAKPVQGHLPKQVRAEAVSKLSSIFVDRQPLRGLNPEDEKKYLATLLEVGPEDREWGRHTRRFWAELRIPVPFTGTPLEIGVDQNGWPIKLMDYVKYQFAKAHALVADSEEEMMRNARKQFYILNPQKESSRKHGNIQIAKMADREFIKACDDETRMYNLLRVLSKVRVTGLTPEKVENLLYDIKQAEPKRFLTAAKDDNLDIKAEIAGFVESGTIQKIGNSYIYLDETLGADEHATVVTLKNPKKSGLLNILRVKHKENIV